MKITGHLNEVEEPFDGMFTQGMVVHETYRSATAPTCCPPTYGSRAMAQRAGRFISTTERQSKSGLSRRCRSRRRMLSIPMIFSHHRAPILRVGSCCPNLPPDRDVIWSEEGVQGAHRFVQRIWRFINDVAGLDSSDGAADAAASLQARKAAHRALAQVERCIEDLGFNKAIAFIYTLVNELDAALKAKASRSALADSAGMLVQMFAPMMPHLAEECWRTLRPRRLGSLEATGPRWTGAFCRRMR